MLISRHIDEKTTLSLLICKNDRIIATFVTNSVVSYTSCVLELRRTQTLDWTTTFLPFVYYNEEGIVTDFSWKIYLVGLHICSNSLSGDALIIIPPLTTCVYFESVFIGVSPEGWQRKAVRCAFTVCQQTWITNVYGTNY